MDTITTVTVEEEKQQRGRAFSLARQQLERQYNCTVTIVPRWLPGVSNTWVLGFDEQVLVGPAPAEADSRPVPEAGENVEDDGTP